MIDRMLRGFVVDMIEVTFIDYPVFNFADCFLCVGVIMLIIHFLFLDDGAIFKKKDGNEEISDN